MEIEQAKKWGRRCMGTAILDRRLINSPAAQALITLYVYVLELEKKLKIDELKH